MIINISLPFLLLISVKILCENITDVGYTLEDFTVKNKKIGNLLYSATKEHSLFESAILVNHNNLFEIKNNGDMFAKVNIDRDEVCKKLLCCPDPICYATLKAYLFKGIPKMFNISIAIHDINDNKPMFQNAQRILIIPESAELYSTHKLPTATDADSAKYGIDGYALSDFTKTFLVIMENNEPSLKLVKILDREVLSTYSIQLTAFDKGSPQLSNSLDITVKVSDINDNTPYFVNTQNGFHLGNISGSHSIELKENHSGDIIYHLHAHDVDEGENAKIFYSISVSQSHPIDVVKQKFSLKSPHETAKIQLRQNLDYENESERQILLVILATDSGKPPKSASASLTIYLLDENDNDPIINETMSKDIKENDPTRQQLKIFSVSDKDNVSQKKVTCVLSDDSKDKFELQMYDWNLYDLYNRISFDYERKKVEVVQIICVDRGKPELTRSKNFNVKIIDENDNNPLWDKTMYEVNLQENDNSRRIVTKITASDADSGFYGAISYNISSVIDPNHTKYVRIDPDSGTIYSDQPVDREMFKELIYHITATDSFGLNSLTSNDPPHQNTTKLVINILDENDNSPKFVGKIKSFKISENMPIDSVVGRLEFYDPDDFPNNEMTISLMEYNTNTHTFQRSKWFTIKYNNTITVRSMLNREEFVNISITVNVEDHGRPARTVTEEIFIEILDENDNAPSLWYPINCSFISTNGIMQTTLTNTKLIQLEANDPDQGVNATISYKITKSNFSTKDTMQMNTKTGEISTNWNNLDRPEIGVYFLQISIDDLGSPPQSTIVILYINVTNTNMSISAEAYMSNIVILILIIVCSLALIVSLIAAIFWVRFRVTGDASNEFQEQNFERQHLNKDLSTNHYSLMSLENNFRQGSFENTNLNVYDPYHLRQQSQLVYGQTNTMPIESFSMIDSSKLTPCEDCFNSLGLMKSQIMESPDIARFRSNLQFDFNSQNTNPSKTLLLQSHHGTDFGSISNTHPPNLIGEPNFSDSGKGGSVEDLNYRIPASLSTFTSTPNDTSTFTIGKKSCQNQHNELNTAKYVQNKSSDTIF